MDESEMWQSYRQSKKERRDQIEPERIRMAIKKLTEIGCVVEQDGPVLNCKYGDSNFKFWPFTGWYSGTVIGSGRGIKNLINGLSADTTHITIAKKTRKGKVTMKKVCCRKQAYCVMCNKEVYAICNLRQSAMWHCPYCNNKL